MTKNDCEPNMTMLLDKIPHPCSYSIYANSYQGFSDCRLMDAPNKKLPTGIPSGAFCLGQSRLCC
jgi:hypothetical protein